MSHFDLQGLAQVSVSTDIPAHRRIVDGAISEITILRQQLEQAQAESLQAIANKVCGELPEGWVINLCMENGAAWVEAIKPSGYTVEIDGADMLLAEQIGEAMRQADEIEKAGGGHA